MSPLRGETVITTEEKAVSACCSGNKQALQSLLQAGLNANLTKDGTSTTLLHLGAYCGQVSVHQFIIFEVLFFCMLHLYWLLLISQVSNYIIRIP